jgi:hypothetical protein
LRGGCGVIAIDAKAFTVRHNGKLLSTFLNSEQVCETGPRRGQGPNCALPSDPPSQLERAYYIHVGTLIVRAFVQAGSCGSWLLLL